MTDYHSRVISNEVTSVNIPRSHPEKDWVPGESTTDDEYRARDRWPQVGDRPNGHKYQTVTGPEYVPDTAAKNVDLVYTVTDKSMDEARSIRRQELTDKFHERLYSGTQVDVGNGMFDLDTSHAASQEVEGLVSYLERNGGTVWIRTRSNENFQANLSQAQQMQNAIDAHWQSCIETDADYGQQIDNAQTYQELEAIPIETWT